MYKIPKTIKNGIGNELINYLTFI